jgi:CDP-glycerol glycerophosphotransferase (TagB/SpsB family)
VEYRQYTSALNDIRADKTADGKTITGSAKEKKVEYINGLNLDYGAKLILFKSEYNADDTYNYDIINYLNGRSDISFEEEVTILRELGFKVDSKGNISWD